MGMLTKEKFMSNIDEYIQSLRFSEKSDSTISKYRLGIMTFKNYADEKKWKNALKDRMLEYKKYLENKYSLSTANLYIIALNGYLKYIDESNLCLNTLKTQEQHNNLENSISMDEYKKMSSIAKTQKKNDIYYIMLAISSTGIRISELKYLTVDALVSKGLRITNKGKSRFVAMSEQLCGILSDYCKDKDIRKGYIFFGKNSEKPIDRRNVSRRLKKIAKIAEIDEIKAYPHSLRHLFAKRYMEKVGNITGLKNILGHSSLTSTMIYTSTTSDEKRKDMDKLGFY